MHTEKKLLNIRCNKDSYTQGWHICAIKKWCLLCNPPIFGALNNCKPLCRDFGGHLRGLQTDLDILEDCSFPSGSLGMWLVRNAGLFEDKFISSFQCVVQSRSIFFNYKSPKSVSIDSIFMTLLINLGNGVILTAWG